MENKAQLGSVEWHDVLSFRRSLLIQGKIAEAPKIKHAKISVSEYLEKNSYMPAI